MESTYLLYTATRDPRLLSLGASLLHRIRDRNFAKCGYASVRDVQTGGGGAGGSWLELLMKCMWMFGGVRRGTQRRK